MRVDFKIYKWTPEEDEVLREFYPHLTNKEMSDKLDLSEAQISGRARFLGLKKVYVMAKMKKDRRVLTSAEEELERRIKEIDDKLGDMHLPTSELERLTRERSALAYKLTKGEGNTYINYENSRW